MKYSPHFDNERLASPPRVDLGGDWNSTNLGVVTAIVDFVAIAVGFGAAILIAALIRDVFGTEFVSSEIYLRERVVEMILMGALAIGVFAFGGLYRRSGWELDEVRRVCAGIALVALFDATLQYATHDHTSRLWFLAAYPLVAVNIISFRMAFRLFGPVQRALTAHVVLLGSGVPPETFVNELRESRSSPLKLLQNMPFERLDGRSPDMLARMLDRLAARAGVPPYRLLTILVPSQAETERAQNTINMLNQAGRPYSVVLPFDGLARQGATMQKMVGADMVMIEMRHLRGLGGARLFKRVLDFSAALFGIILLCPLMLVTAGMIALDRGPIFFRQQRVGREGRRFKCLKFRTMLPDAEHRLRKVLDESPEMGREWDTHQKLKDDPRVTPLGSFLRKTSIDELPQLFNVLLGDMSLVGPRPIVAPELPGYNSDLAYFDNPDFLYYLQCTPGITGLWQVSGRASTTHDERIRLDRWYARNWSFWLDLMILFKTVRVVLGRAGSL